MRYARQESIIECVLSMFGVCTSTYLAAVHHSWFQLNFNARIEYTRRSNTLPSSNIITVIFAIRFIHFNWLTCFHHFRIFFFWFRSFFLHFTWIVCHFNLFNLEFCVEVFVCEKKQIIFAIILIVFFFFRFYSSFFICWISSFKQFIAEKYQQKKYSTN